MHTNLSEQDLFSGRSCYDLHRFSAQVKTLIKITFQSTLACLFHLSFGTFYMKIKNRSLWRSFIVLSLIVLLSACNASANLPFTDVNNQELESLLDEGVTLVDIRRPEEWAQTGVVRGSKKLTFFFASGRVNPQFLTDIEKVVPKDKPVALICRTGNRTRAAGEFLAKEMGYADVYNVKHGITGWMSEKRPVIATR